MHNKKMIFDLDLDRCVGCFACAVACMDQNDINPQENEAMWREVTEFPQGESVSYISSSCMHCDDAPCVIACPTGAIVKDNETGLVIADDSLCIGCHSCLMSCPYSAPKFGTDGKMNKCKGCIERVENGLIPACVRVCPTRALKFDSIENIKNIKKEKMIRKIIK